MTFLVGLAHSWSYVSGIWYASRWTMPFGAVRAMSYRSCRVSVSFGVFTLTLWALEASRVIVVGLSRIVSGAARKAMAFESARSPAMSAADQAV